MRFNKKRFIKSASILALSLTPVAAAIAQSSEESGDSESVEQQLEEVVVTGTRASLRRALDQKRSAIGTVDGISAEGLGKFPDANIAEALQRISGVTIDRTGGEGQFVTVRGFGPSFNTVLVNGRKVASEVGGREFSFDLFPSELISGSQVYKSGVARLQEGGIGATINLTTARPLEAGNKSVISARALADDNSGNTDPQVFGLISRKFANDTIGVLVSGSFQERSAELRTLDTRGYLTGDISSLDANVIAPEGVTRFSVPQNLQLGEITQNRERTNIQTVLQYQPNDQLLVTLDGVYNEFTLESESAFFNSFFSLGDLDNFVLDQNGVAQSFDQNANGANEARSENDGRPTETVLGGINIRWTPSDSFEHGFDFSYSSSENRPSGPDTGQTVLGFRAPFSFVNSNAQNSLPSIELSNTTAELLDPGNFFFHVAQFGGEPDATEEANVVDSSITEFRYDGVFSPEAGGVDKIRFGFNLGEEDKEVDIVRTNEDTIRCFFCGFFVDVPDNLENELLFEVTDNLLSEGEGGFFDSNGERFSTFLGNSLAADTAAIATSQVLGLRDEALGLPAGTSEAIFNSFGGLTGVSQVNSFSVEEEITSFYVETDLVGEVSSLPWSMNLGLRYVDTTTRSTGIITPLLDVTINGQDTTEFNRVLGDSAQSLVTEESENTFILPTFSAKLDLNDKLVLRFGVSETLSRPQLGDLAPRFNIINTRPNNFVASAGNSSLEPFTSTNLDIGFEYYFDDFSYISASFFDKRVDNFIVNTNAVEGLPIANSDNIDDPRIVGNVANFDVSRPTNSEVADVEGVELAAQFSFDSFLPFDGAGLAANFLFLDSNAEVSTNSAELVSFGLPGLSDSQNVQLFYSTEAWDARISYSRRDEFLETLNNIIGGGPVFVDEFEQVDFKISYTFGSEQNYSLFLEGTNVLDEEIRKRSSFSNEFIQLTNTGARYGIGLRAEF